MISRARGKKTGVDGEDHISRLPDDILGDIISLLPTKDGARTQIILLLVAPHLALRSSQHRARPRPRPLAQNRRPPLPASARRFSSTLRLASFGGCSFPDGDAGGGGALQLPHLKQLGLFNVRISERSLHGLLAGCPVLQSLVLAEDIAGCSCIRIASRTIRSIGVRHSSQSGDAMLQQLIIDDAPCLERLLLFGQIFHEDMVISVISAPKLYVLGQLPVEHQPTLKFAATVIQGSRVVNSTMPVPSVKVLALTHKDLSLDVVIDFMKCFPCLENLYIKMTKMDGESSKVTNAWCHKHRNLIDTLDIRLKKIVLTAYRDNRAHVNFAKFFVLNARGLESMVLDVAWVNNNTVWVERQKKLLQVENRASRGAQFHFVYHFGRSSSLECIWSKQVHDLSTIDPFLQGLTGGP
ncbi:hypothetical protein HU200_027893 [Digitaria exilis]|uniref:F-box/LRR-repeat protein 15/At3g58940/PEG3-like LRR domain-containing protein n=1 Tax=Digitaria exilis TaxID=1010633 RepID=A0A835EU51_9POAL|nr:hypothetical protein HU200_027893 [Digitaria exilis]